MVAHDAHAHPNPNPQDDPAPAPLIDVATLSLIIFIIAVGAVMALYFQWEERYVEATYQQDYPARSFYLHQDTALVVDRPAWVDPQAGIAAIRIDQAIEIVAADLAAGGDGLPDIATQPAAAPDSQTAPAQQPPATQPDAERANETAGNQGE